MLTYSLTLCKCYLGKICAFENKSQTARLKAGGSLYPLKGAWSASRPTRSRADEAAGPPGERPHEELPVYTDSICGSLPDFLLPFCYHFFKFSMI